MIGHHTSTAGIWVEVVVAATTVALLALVWVRERRRRASRARDGRNEGSMRD